MPNNSGKYDIHQRVFDLVLLIIRLTKHLGLSTENKIFASQIIRSASSIGANLQEAEGASTKKEFKRGCTLAKREAKETLYWLKLIHAINPSLNRHQINHILDENTQIIKIITTIAK